MRLVANFEVVLCLCDYSCLIGILEEKLHWIHSTMLLSLTNLKTKIDFSFWTCHKSLEDQYMKY